MSIFGSSDFVKLPCSSWVRVCNTFTFAEERFVITGNGILTAPAQVTSKATRRRHADMKVDAREGRFALTMQRVPLCGGSSGQEGLMCGGRLLATRGLHTL